MRILATIITCAFLATPAFAQGPSFTAQVDRNQVGLGQVFAYEVTLSLTDGAAESYRRPEFRGFRVVGERPSQSTQVQMGGGGMQLRQEYSWRYDLIPLQKGNLTIGPASIRVGGQELRTSSISITVLDANKVPAPRKARGIPGFPGFPFPGFEPDVEPESEPDPAPLPTPPAAAQDVNTAGRNNFLRASASKTKVYVGQPILAEWSLYLTQRQDKYSATKEPRTDGFWVEDLQVPTRRGGLALTEQVIDGRVFSVGPLLRKALFPLATGTYTISPLEADISRVDFFGATLRSEHLKSEPLTIEVLPLPAQGRPAAFDTAAVGTFSISAAVDRESVNVGDALTLTVTISGQGNLRKLALPTLPKLAGAKVYDPKADVVFDSTEGLSGKKTAEYLILPERPGTLEIPPLTFTSFDPEARTYQTQKTHPIRIQVAGTANPAVPASPAVVPRGTENLIALDLRPPRTRLHRDLGAALYRSSAFLALLVGPPVLFLGLVFGQSVRTRLGRETDSTRQRKLRRQADHRLRTAATHLAEGRTLPALGEIERVLREYLTGKLGRRIAGMSRDELKLSLQTLGAGPEMVEGILSSFDTCDRARFAPGSLRVEEASAVIERAGEILAVFDRLAPRNSP